MIVIDNELKRIGVGLNTSCGDLIQVLTFLLENNKELKHYKINDSERIAYPHNDIYGSYRMMNAENSIVEINKVVVVNIK